MTQAAAARRLVVEASLLALGEQGRMVYSGRNRPTVERRWHAIDEGLTPPAVPRYADCSSLATWCLWVARDHGAHDPSEREWRPGSTHTMEPNGRVVDLDDALPGALLFYANSVAGRHVATLVERVADVPFVVSFGFEGGPDYAPWYYRRELFGHDDLTSVRDYIDR